MNFLARLFRKPEPPALICNLCHLPFQAGSFTVCAGCLNADDEIGRGINATIRIRWAREKMPLELRRSMWDWEQRQGNRHFLDEERP